MHGISVGRQVPGTLQDWGTHDFVGELRVKWLVGILACACIVLLAVSIAVDVAPWFSGGAVAESRIKQTPKSDLLNAYHKRTERQLRQYLESVDKGDLLQVTASQPEAAEPPVNGTETAQTDTEQAPPEPAETPPMPQAEETPAATETDDLLADDSASGTDDLLADDSTEQTDDLLGGDDAGQTDDLLAGDSDQTDDLLGGDDAAGGDDLLADDSAGGEDDLLTGDSTDDVDDALLVEAGPETEEPSREEPEAPSRYTAAEEHARLFVENKYPSSQACAVCHPKHYEEWSVSSHAYAQLSPVYMAMQVTINKLTSGTTGDFCIRCHNQVGMNLGESIYISNLDRSPTSREGITCVVCHRVNQAYGKVSGRIALEQGDLFSTIYGPTGGAELNRVLATPETYRVNTKRGGQGRDIHVKAEQFFSLTESSFCGTCHDVTLPNGFRLEEAFAEWQQSPAAARGESCQDCHMGRIQGKAAGYEWGPAAMVGDEPTKNRRITNHFFAGPDYSIIHPGLFPHNTAAADFKSLRQWLQFRWKRGWGTDAFEENVSNGYRFPKAWDSVDDRYEGREIIVEQLKLLAKAKHWRYQVLRNGFKVSDINVQKADRSGLTFDLDVSNGTDGHGVPTGFDAERLIFLQVTVTDPQGKVVFKSGDRDPNGDVRDAHSLYVHNGELPLDDYLFNLQSKFVVRLVRGGEREQILAVNTSAAAQPFVRPERRATIIYGRPRGARKHKQTIEPLQSRNAEYKVKRNQLTVNGVYKIKAKFIVQMVPVNLIAKIRIAGFDYGMSAKGIADRVVAGAAHLYTRTAKVRIDGL